MNSSKTVSNRQLFVLVLLFQQSGVFWLLPYFLVRDNGLIGSSAILAGVLAGIIIILIGRYWCTRMPDGGFITALRQCNHGIGRIVGLLFIAVYLLYTVVTLYSFVDVTQRHLLQETPRILLCLTVVILVGIMSWGGLETIVHMSILSVAALVIMAVVSVAGTFDLFVLENGLPLQLKRPDQFGKAMMHSAFCYSGLLSLFMVYPAVKDTKSATGYLLLGVCLGAMLHLVWETYALCIFGEYSLQTILWIPAHLARMVQISSFVDQTESLFVVLWMTIVLTNGSLLLWCASDGMHQLRGRDKTIWGHSAMLLLLLLGMLMLHNSMELMQLESVLAWMTLVLLPLLLLSVIVLTPKRRKWS